MSQEKVDRYKKEKSNRKQTMRKQKIMRMVRNTGVGVVALVLVGWLGYSAYDLYQESRPREVAEVDYTAVNTYLQSFDSDSE